MVHSSTAGDTEILDDNDDEEDDDDTVCTARGVTGMNFSARDALRRSRYSLGSNRERANDGTKVFDVSPAILAAGTLTMCPANRGMRMASNAMTTEGPCFRC
jgi:hypothetical protein